MRIKCMMLIVIPSPNPNIVKSTTVPNWRSSQMPAKPGNTISKETVVIRDTHRMAVASGVGSSEGSVTKIGWSKVCRGQRAPRLTFPQGFWDR